MKVNATFSISIKGFDSPEHGKLDEFAINYQLDSEYTPEELTTTITNLVDIFKMALQADQPKVSIDEAPSGIFSNYTQVDPKGKNVRCPKCDKVHRDPHACPHCGQEVP